MPVLVRIIRDMSNAGSYLCISLLVSCAYPVDNLWTAVCSASIGHPGARRLAAISVTYVPAQGWYKMSFCDSSPIYRLVGTPFTGGIRRYGGR